MGELKSLILVTVPRWHPHQIAFLTIGPLITLGYLLSENQASPLSQLPDSFVILMYVSLLIGGIIGLTGVIGYRRLELATLLEQAGLLIQAGGVLFYLLAVLMFIGLRAWTLEASFIGWFLANLSRSYQIHQQSRGGYDTG